MNTATPSRKEAREAAREERRRREEEEALRAKRNRRLAWAGGIGLAAMALVAVVIAIAAGGGEESPTGAAGSGLEGTAAVRAEYAGIPQNGIELGNPDAPATIMVFADLQCPFCADWENNAMPDVVERYVKPGKLKMVFQTLTFVGPDSQTAGKAVAAASLQDKLFEYASIFYRNQGEENTGYVTPEFIEDVARATPGLDVAKWKTDLGSPEIGSVLSRAQTAADQGQIESTPSFLVARGDEPLAPFQPSQLTPKAFRGKLDQLTR